MLLLSRLVEYVQNHTHYTFYKKLCNAESKKEIDECIKKGCEFSGSSSSKLKVMFMGRTDKIYICCVHDNGTQSEEYFTWDQLVDAVYRKEFAQVHGVDYSFTEQIALF